MITYLYWLLVIVLILAVLYVLGHNNEEWKVASIVALSIFLVGFIAYYFHFQQIFVKHYGGQMSISVPDGERHITATWKGDNLWIENYDPRTGDCHFREYSRGNLLQGKVTLKNCNPLALQGR
ncbi:MAG: hypothetical protein IMF14_09295 [Proteobacteria bacterium]|nr:hypothetical protein [Pseudomonadota bacterium]